MKIVAWPAHKNSSRNPYQHLLYRAIEHEGSEVLEFAPQVLISERHIRILHVHWPDAFLAADTGVLAWTRMIALRAMIGVAHFRGMKIVWTAHNFMRKGQRNEVLMRRWFWPWWVRTVDGVIYLTRFSEDEISAQEPQLRDVPHIRIPHGNYWPITRPLSGVSSNSRSGLPHVLYAGTLSRYKRPGSLVSAFGRTKAGSMQLVIAGELSQVEPDLAFEPAIERLSGPHRENLRLRLEFLTDSDLVREIEMADLVVFPYGPVFNSGAILFALSVGRPVLATAQPVFEELQADIGDEWVWTYKGDLGGAELEYYAARAASLRSARGQPELGALDWLAIAHKTLGFYESVMKRDRLSK